MAKELLDLSKYTLNHNGTGQWKDIKSNGQKNPRARCHKKLTDQEYLDKIKYRVNKQPFVYN